MKNIFIAFILLSLIMVGCSESSKTDSKPKQISTNVESIVFSPAHNWKNVVISKVDFSGHTYIITVAGSGTAMIHDPGCKCTE